ncbi:hypothetical protein QYF61_009113 [Mycteria americana]|uniref:Uncharacterized protein n=1 Tax=Mycteria americana TaxID=33587 RepID=A0AAN7NL64_MYCAM|nr:hypothetical protein QYF61_009113 [Mycteria americana]
MGQKYVTFEKRLRNLSLFSLAKQQLSGDLIAAHSSLNGNCTDGRTKFLLVLADGTVNDTVTEVVSIWGQKLELLQRCREEFRLDIRKFYFTERVVKHWNRLPREVVESPSLEVFKRHLDEVLRDMV